MKLSSIFTLAASAAVANAHAQVFAIYVNGVEQGLGLNQYIRSPPNNNPVKDLKSNNLTCNVNNVAVPKTVKVNLGDKVTFEWHHNDMTAADDIIDLSHKGPVQVYIAPTASNGAGDVWVKLFASGYAAGKWGVDNLIAARGKHYITIPSLTAGTYLLRPEIIALHEGDTLYDANPARGAQFYMECIQIEVGAGGSLALPAGVAIPGVYTDATPGVHFNLYGGHTSYPIPGPAVWSAATGASGFGDSGAAAPAGVSSSVAVPAAVVSTSAPAVSSSVAPLPTAFSFSSLSEVTAVVATASAPLATYVPSVIVSSSSSSSSSAAAAAAAAQTSSAPAVTVAVPTTLATVTRAAPAPTATDDECAGVAVPVTGGGAGAPVPKYWQCGGRMWTGATACVAGTTCVQQNEYYFQCL